jgi:hypothetical protein
LEENMKKINKIKGLVSKALIVLMLPFLGGCIAGGGLGLGALFGLFGGAAAGIGGLLASLGGGAGGVGGAAATGAGIATISNPEPASMILFGSGVAAMTYFKNRKKT